MTFHVAYITYKFTESVDIHVLVLLVHLMQCFVFAQLAEFSLKMDHIFIVSLLFVACTSLTGAIIPKYSIAYFKQKLDHFNFVQDATFSQRYLYTGTVSNLNMTLRLKKASVLPIPVLNFGLEEQDALVSMISQTPQAFASGKCVKALLPFAYALITKRPL